jgi:hypothetical protein
MGKLQKRSGFIWIGLGVLTALFFATYIRFAADDAYITYRYARNLAAGLGFTYNPGEWVLGTTTPLYTLLLAAGTALTRLDAPTLSILLGALSLWVSAGALYEMGKPAQPLLSALVAIVFILNPFQRFFMGMESYCLNALIILTLWAYQRDQRLVCGVTGGLAILTRYEVVVLLGILTIVDGLRRRRVPFWALGWVLPVGAWATYAWIAFGSPIPLSVTVKLAAPRIPFLVGYAAFWLQLLQEWPGLAVALLDLVIGAAALLITRRILPGYGWLLLWSLVYLAVAVRFAGSFPWYYAPLVPAMAVLMITGVEFITRLVTALAIRSPDGVTVERPRLGTATLGFIAIALLALQLVPWAQVAGSQRGELADNRYAAYRQAADWLARNASAGETISCFEIGYIGYFTQMPILDMSGLVTPALLPYAAAGNLEMLRQVLRQHAPTYVIIIRADKDMLDLLTADPHYRHTIDFDQVLLYRRVA